MLLWRLLWDGGGAISLPEGPGVARIGAERVRDLLERLGLTPVVVDEPRIGEALLDGVAARLGLPAAEVAAGRIGPDEQQQAEERIGQSAAQPRVQRIGAARPAARRTRIGN